MAQDKQSVRLISGPYRATKLWNAAVRAFHGGMPTSRHRRGLRVFDDCFTGSEATAWLHQHLTTNPNFGSTVTQEQATTLFKKFLKSGLLEDAVSGATAVQLKEKGLYRFSSVSPLRALRTPGRNSTSDLRASTRRLQATQQQTTSGGTPPPQDAKAVVGDATSPVSGHYASVPRSRNLNLQQQSHGRQSGRESYRRLSHEAALANARDHQLQNKTQKQLNLASGVGHIENENWRNMNNGGGDSTGKLISANSGNCLLALANDKENVGVTKDAVMDERLRSKVELMEVEGGDDISRYFKRPALRAIENTAGGGGTCNSLMTKANNTTAAFNNTNCKDELNSDVYIPLGEVLKCKGINSRDSSNDLALKQGNNNKFRTDLDPKQHNAINTMSEFNGEKNAKNNFDMSKADNNCGDKKTKSRVKSFLIKSSGNSKYHYFIPKFGADTTTSTCSSKAVPTLSTSTSYANSKTISPKLLHAVTAAAQSGQPASKAASAKTGVYQNMNTLRRKSLEKACSGGFAIPKVPEPPGTSQFAKPTAVARVSYPNLVKKVSQSDLAPMKFNSGSSIVSVASSGGSSSQSNLLAAFVGNMAMEPRLEQAYIESWLQILDAGVCGTPLSLPSSLVHGATLIHNQQRVTARGVVHVSPGHPDDLPHWLLAAMRFLAHWPSSHSEGKEEGGSIPNYPGVEADVYRMVRDYFVHQTTPIIPSAVATALLEVLSAVEFLDLTFREPKHRFGNSSRLSAKGNKNANLDPLSSLNPKQRRSFVDLQALEDDCCEESVFATLPRASKKNSRGNDTFSDEEGRLCATDSVEDLMLNMSIAGLQQQDHSINKNNSEAMHDLDNSCSASPEPQSSVITNTDQASMAKRSVRSETPASNQSSPYPSHSSFGSSNVFLDDAFMATTNQHRSNSRHNSIPEMVHDQENSFQSRESEESSRNISAENTLGNLTQLSSTNISHIEHFNKSNTGAVYVTGDDVRRRKKKRRFFSRANKKKKEGEGIEQNLDRTAPDLRRYSVYECLPLVSDVSGSSEYADGYSRPESIRGHRSTGDNLNDGGHELYSVVKPIALYGSQMKSSVNNGPYLSVSNPSLHSGLSTNHNTAMKSEYPFKTPLQKQVSLGPGNLLPDPAAPLDKNGVPKDSKGWVSGAPSWSDVSVRPPSSTNNSADAARASLLRSTDIDHVALPPNSCFETAFTSDSPKTRIIPQKSVDTLHLRQLKRRRKSSSTLGQPRPKSIAVPQHYAARFTEMTDHEAFHSYRAPADGHSSMSCLGSPSAHDNKHYWNNSPSMFEISSPYRPLSVADLATEPRSLQTCGSAAPVNQQPRPRTVPVIADTSFNRSLSTGDLNLGGEAWPSEQRLVTADSSSGNFSVDTGHKGSTGALSSMSSRGLSLVNRVRDSIRRRKGGNKDTTNTSSSSVVASRKRLRSRKGNYSTTGADSSNGDNTSGCHSINSSSASTNASYNNAGRELKSSFGGVNPSLTKECQRPVQYAKVINAERGREVHQQNVQTLRRLRTLSGGFTNPCLSLTPSASNQCDNPTFKSSGETTATHAPKEGSVISPIVGFTRSGPGMRELSTPCAKPSLLSPFSPSSGGGDTMDTESLVSFSDHRSFPDTVESRPSSSSCCSSEAFTSARAAPSFSHRTSVTTTNYNTHLSTQYARNQYRNRPGSVDSTTSTPFADRILAEGAHQPGCLNPVTDDSRREQQQSSTMSRAVMSTPVSALGSSRSPSLSSLYTTALACYDESDPQPSFGLTQLTADAGDAAGAATSSLPLAFENSQSEYECTKKKISESPCSCCNSFTKLKTSRDCSSSNNSSSAVSALRCKQNANDSKDRSSDCHHDSSCCKTSPSTANNTNENPATAGSVDRQRPVPNCMGEGVTSSGSMKRARGRSSWKDAVPRVHTEEGTARLVSCVQLLLLLLQPVARRRLHLLLRLLHKMSNNTKLDLNSISSKQPPPVVTAATDTTFVACRCPPTAPCCHHKQRRRCSTARDVSNDSGVVVSSPLQHQSNLDHSTKASTTCDAKASTEHNTQQDELLVSSSTRDRVLSELGWCILRGCSFSAGGVSSDEASCRRLLTFLVDQHHTLLRPSPQLDDATAHRLNEALCFPSQQQARSENNRCATTTATRTVRNDRSATSCATTNVAAGFDIRDGCSGWSNESNGWHRDERGSKTSRTSALDAEAGYTNTNNMNVQRGTSALAGIRHVRFDDDDTSKGLTSQTVQKVATNSNQATGTHRANTGMTSMEDLSYTSVLQGSPHDEAFLLPSRHPLPPNPNPHVTEFIHTGPISAEGVNALSYRRYKSTSHFPVTTDHDDFHSRSRLPTPSPPPPYPFTDHRTSDRTTTAYSNSCSSLPRRMTSSNGLLNSRRPLSVAFNSSTHDVNLHGVNNETYYYMDTDDAGSQEYYDRLRSNAAGVSYAKGCNVAPSAGHSSYGGHASGLASTGQGFSYCVQVAPSEWEQQKAAEQQQQHLQTLLQQIVQDPSRSDRDKKTRVKQFAAVHPSVYHCEVLNIPPHLRCSDGGAPAKKRGVLRGMMKLASLSSLARNKHATKHP